MNRFLFILRFLFDKNVPMKEKWWVIIPLVYIISPVDLIPAPIIGFSVVDDLVMLAFLLTKVYEKTKKYYYDEKNNDKDIIENVEYEINEDEDEE